MRTVILPDTRLAPFVRMFMAGRFDGGPVHLPASADIQLLIYLSGGVAVCGAAGTASALPDSFVVGATMRPRWYAPAPGSRFFGIAFRPGGFQACFGIPADIVTERILALDALLPAAIVQRWRECCMAADGVPGLLQAARWLLTAMAPPSGSARFLPVLPLASLLQPVSGLSASLGMSTRQFERRFLASHGVPLRDYRRLARFSGSLARLMAQPARRPGLAALAQDAHYSDQAHFSRDFQQFIGATPSAYLASRAAGDTLYRLWQFDREALDGYADLA